MLHSYRLQDHTSFCFSKPPGMMIHEKIHTLLMSYFPVSAAGFPPGGLGRGLHFPTHSLRQRYEKLGSITRQEMMVAVPWKEMGEE